MSAYAYSESVSAGPHTPEHISPVGSEGLRLGGGAPYPICGMRWQNGWHVDRMVTPENLASLASAGHLCRGCVAAWEAPTEEGAEEAPLHLEETL